MGGPISNPACNIGLVLTFRCLVKDSTADGAPVKGVKTKINAKKKPRKKYNFFNDLYTGKFFFFFIQIGKPQKIVSLC